MKTPRLTPARLRFLRAFDEYTNYGVNPHTLDNAWQKLGVQPRTINFCRRNGLLAKAGLPETYVVSLEARELAGLSAPAPVREERIFAQIIKRRTRRRSSAMTHYTVTGSIPAN